MPKLKNNRVQQPFIDFKRTYKCPQVHWATKYLS